jgi:hypothetical protein
MEEMAFRFRKDLKLKDSDALDPFRINLDGVKLLRLKDVANIPEAHRNHLEGDGKRQWSAMSVPLNADQEEWCIVVNDGDTPERQKVSLLEEFWHILQGHKLTSIKKVGAGYGRSFEAEDEHDAYYLAAATLVPRASLARMISEKNGDEIAAHFGVSKDLIEYRIKRLGLWNQYKGKNLSLQ